MAPPSPVVASSPEEKGPAPNPVEAASVKVAATPGVGVSSRNLDARSVRDDLIGTVRSILDGLSLEDK